MQFEKLLNVCDVYQPKTISTKNFVTNGKYFVYGANGIIGRYNEYNHEDEEVLLGCRGACGSIHLSKPFSWINGNAMVVTPKNKTEIDKKYLAYCLMSVNKDTIITGTAQPQITRTNLANFEIPICEFPEQQRIVAKIEELFSELDNSVAILKKVKEQLEVYRLCLLKELMMCKTETVNFGNIAYIELGKMLDKKKNKGVYRKYLRNQNVRWFTFDLSDLLEMKIEDSECNRYSVKRGDLIVCEGGEPGRCAVWESDEIIYYQKALHRIRFKESTNAKFYMYYLALGAKTGTLNEYFTGTGIKHLTVESLNKFIVPFLSKEKQDIIVENIEDNFCKINEIEKTVISLEYQTDALRQSILKKVFGGEL